jgi:hypothetical protein
MGLKAIGYESWVNLIQRAEPHRGGGGGGCECMSMPPVRG